jgi:hypothetical protein
VGFEDARADAASRRTFQRSWRRSLVGSGASHHRVRWAPRRARAQRLGLAHRLGGGDGGFTDDARRVAILSKPLKAAWRTCRRATSHRARRGSRSPA